MLERPVEEILRTGEPDFGFCLAWANQAWTRTWLGSGEVLMDQPYSPEDDEAHGRYLAEVFADPRYLRVDGRPAVRRVPGRATFPTRRAPARRGGEVCATAGVRRPVPGRRSTPPTPRSTCARRGSTLMLDFQPALGRLPHTDHAGVPPLGRVRRNLRLGVRDPRLVVFDDAEARRLMHRRDRLTFPTVPTVLVGWDNTARRGRRAIVLVNSTPSALRASLDAAVASVADEDPQHRLVFLNAWNEWAEGNYLEPDREDGRARLDAVAGGVSGGPRHPLLSVVDGSRTGDGEST